MTAGHSADRGTQYLPSILATLVVALAPHILRLPPWMTIWVLVFWGYAWGIARRGWLTPSEKVRRVGFNPNGFNNGVRLGIDDAEVIAG